MGEAALSRVAFGIVGVITSDTAETPDVGRRLSSAFRPVPASVQIVWSGEAVAAFCCYHAEDARLEPGSYQFLVPRARSCQGIAYGQLFQADIQQSEANRGLSWPQAVSAKMVSGFAESGAQSLAALNGPFGTV